MPINRLALVVFLFAILPGCFVTDELFVEKPEVDPYNDLQGVAEKNIEANIKSELTENDIYHSFGYSKLIVKKPVEIAELDALEKQAILNPTDTDLKKEIEQKKAFIQSKKIERSALLDHVFTITADTTTIHLLELGYVLNDTLGIIDSYPKIILDIPIEYELILEYYFNEYTIFMAPSYAEGRKLSREFYRYFKAHLETLTSITEKSEFLKHTLNICIELKAIGTFDQNKITQALFTRYILEERTDIKEYEPLAFSTLYETKNNDDNSVVGYYFFHKFSGNYTEQKDTNVVLVEFSPYYEIQRVFQLDGTFESYVNQNK